jgi:alpha-L-arabinofuranosidase
MAPARILAAETLTGTDLKAANTFEKPTLVGPRALETPRPGSTMTFKLPARSYSVVQVATS